MKFTTPFLAVAIAALFASAEACKCVLHGKNYPKASRHCCNKLNGDFNPGDKHDCAAGSISEHLSEFRHCCHGWEHNGHRLTSDPDCDFPGQAEVETVEDDGEVDLVDA